MTSHFSDNIQKSTVQLLLQLRVKRKSERLARRKPCEPSSQLRSSPRFPYSQSWKLHSKIPTFHSTSLHKTTSQLHKIFTLQNNPNALQNSPHQHIKPETKATRIPLLKTFCILHRESPEKNPFKELKRISNQPTQSHLACLQGGPPGPKKPKKLKRHSISQQALPFFLSFFLSHIQSFYFLFLVLPTTLVKRVCLEKWVGREPVV